jgi:hypothetical protein
MSSINQISLKLKTNDSAEKENLKKKIGFILLDKIHKAD